MKVREGSSRATLVRGAALILLVGAGCGDDVPASQLVTVTDIAPGGAECAQRGGVSIQQGTDKNKNGKLDMTEVTSTTVVCEGPGTDPGSLISLVNVPEGSATCPYGGVTIQTGLDNGDGGGTAGNGTLEAGEVDTTSTTCNGPVPGQFNDVPPTGAAGTAQLLLNGGTGSGATSTGGAAGGLTLSPVGQSPSLFVFRTGTVDASFTPTTVTITAGARPLVVSSGTKQLNPLPGSPTLNEFYLSGGQVVQNTAMGNQPVTSISVASGATLAIGDGSSGSWTISMPQVDVSIDGTLTTTPTAGNARPSLSIQCRQFTSSSSATIDLHGPAAGSAGGAFTVQSAGAGPVSFGPVVNRAAINVSGTAAASGGTAGAGGSVLLFGGLVQNTGAINASGADQTVGAGNSGGSVQLLSYGAGNMNSGAIDLSGGDGSTSAGAGGSFVAQVLDFGSAIGGTNVGSGAPIVNSGAITTSGGAITSNVCPACAGGAAGSIQFVSGFPSRVEVRSSGALTARGGTTVGTGASNGGAGGSITINTFGSSVVDDTPTVDLSGTIDLSGGAGHGGGSSGGVSITVLNAPSALVRMLGYASIQAKGGNGVDAGGTGGTIVASRNASATDGAALPRTRMLLDADVTLDGGDCSNAAGCSGGSTGTVSYSAQYGGSGFVDPYQPAGDDFRIGGALSMVGGDGTTPGGGLVGPYFLRVIGNATISGAVTARPGATIGTGTGGSNSFFLVTSAYGTVQLTGALDVRGRDSTGGNGGSGATVFVQGRHVVASSTIDTRGGNAAASATGGSGGSITITSTDSATTYSATTNVAGGTGMTAGVNGTVLVDGVVR